jgi:predicted MPP superfamily phosphohydrolase
MWWSRIVFGLLALTLFGGLNYFLFRRLVADVVETGWVRRTLLAGLVTIYASVPLLRTWGMRGGEPPSTASFAALLFWGLLLNVLLVLVVVEVGKWLILKRPRRPSKSPQGVEPPPPDQPERRQFLARAGAAAAMTVGGGLTTFGVYKAMTPPEVTTVPVKLPGLPRALDGFTIVQLSDIHVGPVIQEKFLEMLVREANRLKPDLVAITGDLVDGEPDSLAKHVARLKSLVSRHGTYFCSGNHDYYSGWERWANTLSQLQFTVLRNRAVSIGDSAASFDLIGVEDFGGRFGRGQYDLDKATAGLDPGRASVLLAHQPTNLEAVSEKNIGLQLSGHTHGGQLFPGTLIATAVWMEKNSGFSKHGNTCLYTSRGCGFVGPPVRIGAPPELVKVVLTSG